MLTALKTTIAILATLGTAIALSACGGGGGRVAPAPVPTPVDSVNGLSLPLPSGHGLEAGEIRVAPGGSAEHGNVVVTCPAGGPACVVTVAADGTASYDHTGGVPTALKLPPDHSISWVDNASAADLADHWHVTVAPDVIADALDLRPAAPVAEGALDTIATAAGQDAPDDVQVLGQAKGFTVGRWTSGPADHMPVTLDWRFIPDVPAGKRAIFDRVAKFWSHHVSGVLEPYERPPGSLFPRADPSLRDAFFAEDTITTRGTYIFVQTYTPSVTGRHGSAHTDNAEITPSAFYARIGTIGLHTDLFDPHPEIGTFVAAHEIGHVFTGGSITTDAYLAAGCSFNPDGTPCFLGPDARYIDVAAGTWTGPAVVAFYGAPAPFFWDGVDFHLGSHWGDVTLDQGVCPTVLSYSCGPTDSFRPGPLDVAWLDDYGYTTAPPDTANADEVYGWGAWGDASAFGVLVARALDTPTDDRLRAAPIAYGIEPATPFEDAHQEMVGTATWTGLLFGADLGAEGFPPVTGNSMIEINLAELDGKVSFTDLETHAAGTTVPFRSSTIVYDVSVFGNAFEDVERRVHGTWFGDHHDEIAGTLLDVDPQVQLIAGFGAKQNQ